MLTLPLCQIYQWENWRLDATRAFLTHARDDVTAYAYENEASVLLESVVLIVQTCVIDKCLLVLMHQRIIAPGVSFKQAMLLNIA